MLGPLRILAIETSCDETAAAVVASQGDSLHVLGESVITQDHVHAEFGGVVPELASRAHLEKLAPAIRQAMHAAGVGPEGLDAVASGHRPGLIGSLLVGTSAAKAFAWSIGRPFLAVDHVQSHLAACHLDGAVPSYPAVGLVASGGHTHVLLLRDPLQATVLARTRDDAAGEAFDKAATLLGLGWPGGPALERTASVATAPIAFEAGSIRDSDDFSFSGLKTAMLHAVRGVPAPPGRPPREPAPPLTPERAANLAAGFQRAVVRALERRLRNALTRHAPRSLLAGGGVVRNAAVRTMLQELATFAGIPLHLAHPRHCTDNAAMIGALGALRLRAGARDPLSTPCEPLSALGSA